MADEYIEDEQSLSLRFTEAGNPGWKLGTKLPNPYHHLDGTIYHFTGSAIVDQIQHRHGSHITFQIVHDPGK